MLFYPTPLLDAAAQFAAKHVFTFHDLKKTNRFGIEMLNFLCSGTRPLGPGRVSKPCHCSSLRMEVAQMKAKKRLRAFYAAKKSED